MRTTDRLVWKLGFISGAALLYIVVLMLLDAPSSPAPPPPPPAPVAPAVHEAPPRVAKPVPRRVVQRRVRVRTRSS